MGAIEVKFIKVNNKICLWQGVWAVLFLYGNTFSNLTILWHMSNVDIRQGG